MPSLNVEHFTLKPTLRKLETFNAITSHYFFYSVLKPTIVTKSVLYDKNDTEEIMVFKKLLL